VTQHIAYIDRETGDRVLITVWHIGRTVDRRHTYGYRMEIGEYADWQASKRTLAEGEDLELGPQYAKPNELAALGVLGSFLGAWQEAWEYGSDASENRNLFPANAWEPVADYLDDLCYELALVSGEIED